MSVFHFSSVSGPLQKDGLKNKINRRINLPTQINIGNEWLYREVMIFPQPTRLLNVRNLSDQIPWAYYSNCSYIYTNKQISLPKAVTSAGNVRKRILKF